MGGLLAKVGLSRRSLFPASESPLCREMVVALPSVRRQRLMVNDPEMIATILDHQSEEFSRPKHTGQDMAAHFDRMIFSAGPTQHGHLRWVIEGLFGPQRLKHFMPRMVRSGRAAQETLQKLAGEDPVDLAPALDRCAADIALRILLSAPADTPTGAALAELLPSVEQAMAREGASAMFLGRQGRRAQEDAVAALASAVDEVIASRESHYGRDGTPGDLAGDLILFRGQDATDAVDPNLARQQIGGMLVHVAASTAATLTWALHLLASEPEIQAEAAEIAAQATSEREPDMHAFARLDLVHRILMETWRLYPPVPFLVRRARKDMDLQGIAIRKNAHLYISQWHLGRHHAYWQAPERFDPDRWSADRLEPDTHIPFSLGPRSCPAAGLARLSASVMLTYVLGAVSVAPGPRAAEPEPGLTLRPKDGLRLVISRR